jgi:hypothetical protein
VYVVFQQDIPGFGSSPNIDSQITDIVGANTDHGSMPQSHALNLDEPHAGDAPTPLNISIHHYILLEYSPVRGLGLYLMSFS